MLARRMLIMASAGLVCLVGIAGCTPAAPAATSAPTEQDTAIATMPAEATATEATVAEATVAEATATDATTADAAAVEATDPVTSGVESNVEAAGDTQTVTSTVEAGMETDSEPMQTQPGAGEEQGQNPPAASDSSQPGGALLTFADTTYGFQVNYPAEFVVSNVPAEQLAQLAPAPVAGYRFMNPQTAASDIAELEPADLEIRVHASSGASLEEWLVANGMLPADGSITPAPFQAANVAGLEVCASTMIAPGCAYFFASGGYFYQLIPATQEGEAMMRSFSVGG